MNETAFYQLLEASRQRPWSEAEREHVQSQLAHHPEWRALWEDEMTLNDLLSDLPPAPLSPLFTSRVVTAALRMQQPLRPRGLSWSLRLRHWFVALTWAQRAAIASLVLFFGLLGYSEYRLSTRIEVAQSVATVSSIAALPSVDSLKDFDAIQRLEQVPPVVDEELLALLQ